MSRPPFAAWAGSHTMPPATRSPDEQGGTPVPIARYSTPDNPGPDVGYVDGDTIYPLRDVDGPATIEALLQLSASELAAAAAAARETPDTGIPLSDVTLLA